MSDQLETSASVTLDLEELFLSGEFGRRMPRPSLSAAATVESEPVQLEHVFRSDVFGHPEVVAAATRIVEESAAADSARPVLVLLQGGGEARRHVEHDTTRYRAIAAVSGVAAAALAVAGLAPGTDQGPGRPPVTEQALGTPPGHGTRSPGGSHSGPNATVGPAATGTAGASAGEGTFGQLASFSTPVATAVPRGATGGGATTPPSPSSLSGLPSPGTAPSGGAGGGAGAGSGAGGSSGMLTPALNVVGNEVTSVGSSVTSTSGDVSQALPLTPVVQALTTVATSAVNNLGGGSPPVILASGPKQ
jgi:hypothetical protein